MVKIVKDGIVLTIAEVDRMIRRHFHVEEDPDTLYLDWVDLLHHIAGDTNGKITLDELLDKLRLDPEHPGFVAAIEKAPSKKDEIVAYCEEWYAARRRLVRHLFDHFYVVVAPN